MEGLQAMPELPRSEEGDVYFLDPRSVRISRNPFGRLVLRVGMGVDEFQDVHPTRAFPLSAPDKDISLADTEGREIGVIRDINELDRESRDVLFDELEIVYLGTRVQAIKSITSNYGISTWEMETDRGPRSTHLRDRSDVRSLPDGRIVLTDVHGVKYEIPGVDSLDERSRALLESEM